MTDRKTRQQRRDEGSGAYPEASTPGPDAAPLHRCEAYGCPLPGALSPNGMGAGPWMCVCHDGVPYAALDAVTAWLRGHRQALGALEIARQGDAFAWEQGDRQRAMNLLAGSDQAPHPTERVGAYANRLTSAIRKATRAAGDRATKARLAAAKAVQANIYDEATV